jgi:RNA-directed DNA polymerase
MKESHRKGVANHPDPESCAANRKVRREALTGAHAGWVLSPERANWSADAVKLSGRQNERGRKREIPPGTTGSEASGMHGNSMHGNQEVPVPPAVLRKRRAGGGTHKGTPLMYGAGKSDRRVVPVKVPNKGDPCGGIRRRNRREGGGSRRTQWKHTRTGHRTG